MFLRFALVVLGFLVVAFGLQEQPDPSIPAIVAGGLMAASGVVLLVASARADSLKTCPHCAERVKLEARICKHCGHEFSDAESPVGPRP